MLRNYFKIALRSLLKNKVYSIINIAGLAMGITAFLLILEFISLEKGVNQFHANLPNMYRVLCQNTEGKTWGQSEPGWAPIAKERFPEVKDYCRIIEGSASGIVKNDVSNTSFREQNIGYAEGNFFNFFSFPLKSGEAKAFAKADVAFISESYAKKYFKEENPVGKTLSLHNQFGNHPYIIGGVYADMGENSDIRFDILFSLETLKNPANLNDNGWARLDNLDTQYISMFFLLRKSADYQIFEKKFTGLRRELQKEKDATTFRIQPLSEVHLASSLSDNLAHNADIKYIYMLGGIALLILLIAWFNYINLSTANSLKRANEVGVRKVIGATQGNLIGQFLGESLLVNGLGLGLGLLLVVLLQPFFNELIGKNLSLYNISQSTFWIYGLILFLMGSLGAGVYTAIALSKFKLIETLKGKITKTSKGIFLRKSLVVSQFSISIVLILITILIYTQLRFMQNKNLGMSINQLVVVWAPSIGLDSTYKIRKEAYLNEIAAQSFVKDYCTSGTFPGRYYNFTTEGFTSPKSKAGDEHKPYSFAIIGERYLKTYDISLKAGRNFTATECNVEWNDNDKVLMNETAIKQLGFASAEEALTQKVKWDERYLQVIGVVKDYNHEGVQNAIVPMIFYPSTVSDLTIKLTTDNLSAKIASIEKIYKKHFAGNPFDYLFMDEFFNRQYASERQFASIFTAAALWAIFIACMGLFGLTTFMVESRTKEIGIRKVFGATVGNIMTLISKDFLILVGIALLIASPIAYYFMEKWLQDFAYRIDIEWWVFVLAGIMASGIALFTISYQAIRAALMNPVKSLKTE
ncbi:MAG: FtsX-like permease family protein [Spirosomataceae bacterium]